MIGSGDMAIALSNYDKYLLAIESQMKTIAGDVKCGDSDISTAAKTCFKNLAASEKITQEFLSTLLMSSEVPGSVGLSNEFSAQLALSPSRIIVIKREKEFGFCSAVVLSAPRIYNPADEIGASVDKGLKSSSGSDASNFRQAMSGILKSNSAAVSDSNTISKDKIFVWALVWVPPPALRGSSPLPIDPKEDEKLIQCSTDSLKSNSTPIDSMKIGKPLKVLSRKDEFNDDSLYGGKKMDKKKTKGQAISLENKSNKEYSELRGTVDIDGNNMPYYITKVYVKEICMISSHILYDGVVLPSETAGSLDVSIEEDDIAAALRGLHNFITVPLLNTEENVVSCNLPKLLKRNDVESALQFNMLIQASSQAVSCKLILVLYLVLGLLNHVNICFKRSSLLFRK